MLLYFAVSENFSDDTMDALFIVLNSKNPKMAKFGLGLLSELIKAYGPELFPAFKFKTVIYAGAC